MSRTKTIVHALASLRLASVLLMMLLVSMAYATMYEQRHGLELTLSAIYEHLWFQLILGLLAVNTALALVVRWPYGRRQMGFLITHVAVLVILGGALVTGVFGERGSVTLREGETCHVFESQRLMLVAHDRQTGRQQSVPVNLASDRPVDAPRIPPLTLGEMTVRVRRYLPDAVPVRRVLNDNPQPSLAVRVCIRNEEQETCGWVFDGSPERAGLIRVEVRPLPVGVSAETAAADTAQSVDRRALAAIILAGADGAMHAVFSPAADEPAGVPIVIGQPLAAPWGSVTLTILERLDHARVVDALEARTPPGDDPRPALELEVRHGEARLELSLHQSARQTVQLGENLYDLEYSPQELPLEFDLTLDAFRIRTYPGTRAPRSYESDVRIRDPRTGQMLGGRVSMNAPLSYGGYDLFQSGYHRDHSGTYSTLSVVHDPGMWIVFAGYGLAILGMLVVLITRIAVHRKVQTRAMEGVGG